MKIIVTFIAKMALVKHLNLTGFKCHTYEISSGFMSSFNKSYNKDSFNVTFSTPNFGKKYISASGPNIDKFHEDQSCKAFEEALLLVKQVYPVRERDAIGNVLLPLIKIVLLVIIGLIGVTLLVNVWIFFTEIYTKQGRDFKRLSPGVVLAICSVFVIFGNIEKNWLRALLILASFSALILYYYFLILK